MEFLLRLLLLLGVAGANIIFKQATLSCDPAIQDSGDCLRGQHCSQSGVCEFGTLPSSDEDGSDSASPNGDSYDENTERERDIARRLSSLHTFSRYNRRDDADPSPSSAPNKTNTNTDATIPTATSTSNMSTTVNATIPTQIDADSDDNDELPTTTSTATIPTDTNFPVPDKNVTADGMCGSSHNDTVCGDWEYGSCCSPYGFCGNSTAHCGDGCQSGPCVKEEFLQPLTFMPQGVPGSFRIVGQSGVPAMIATLMPNGKVVFTDKIENYTQLVLPNGHYAYSAEYDPITNGVVGLSYKTNAFCSGGTFLADGRVLSVGGNGPLLYLDPTVQDGFKGLRYLDRQFDDPDMDYSSWDEPGHELSTARWYPTVQILPDGRQFVVSGSINGLDPTIQENNNPTYEILDRDGYPWGESIMLPMLERNQPYYMYPFLHLLRDGNVFIFVAKSAEIFDVDAGVTVRTLPDLRGDYRTYPNTGGSVLLPLSSSDGWEPDVMVCGGGAYQDLTSPTDPTCGRIRPLSNNPVWEIESMPKGRVMVEGVLLPDGSVIWINGCNRGAQGFGIAKDPIFEPWIYRPDAPASQRWAVGPSSHAARMYHSVALLLLDGTVMIAGSNPVEQPLLFANPHNPMEAFVTEFRVEIYTPHYLTGENIYKRPYDVWLSDRYLPADGRRFTISFAIHENAQDLKVALYNGGYVTHSLHMGHRMLFLDVDGWRPGDTRQEIQVSMPPEPSIAPPGPYVVYVVADGVPSIGQFVIVESESW